MLTFENDNHYHSVTARASRSLVARMEMITIIIRAIRASEASGHQMKTITIITARLRLAP